MAHYEKAGDGRVQATNATEPVSKSAKILHRRQEENLPVFGHLVEHADATHLRYHEREDARNIELFFDLFFVAIFSTFTKNHEINSNEALSSYAVYFGVIWASWLQVCLYDVRFGFDSMFERSTKAIQMCAFIGFASTTATLEMGPTPEVGKEAALSGFQSLNFLMIVSRALFALQYAVAYVLVGRKHPPAKAPLLVTLVMYASASTIYGLMYKFLLVDAGNASGFYGYYAIIAFELSVMSLVVARYECVSFKETHLHKRLMVLTLMILGEGIIVCAFSFAKISSKTGWTANSFGQALCVILSIYFIYCLYFGNSGIETPLYFRPVKQQLYAMLHLPFHLSLALTLEGLRTWTVIANVQYNFSKVYGYLDKVIGETPDVFRLQEFNATTGASIVDSLNNTAKTFKFDKSASWDYMQTALTKMNLAWQDDAPTIGNQTKGDVLRYYFDEFVSLFQNEQFVSNSMVVPSAQIEAAKGSGAAKMDAYFAIFKMVFIYFFICTALVMIILGVFRRMTLAVRDRYDNVMITVRMAMGIFLGLLALLALMDDRITSYINSGVLLPTLLFVLLFVVVFEKGLTIFAINRGQKFSNTVRKDDPEHGQKLDMDAKSVGEENAY